MSMQKDLARTVIRISGGDRIRFLQDLVTNNVTAGDTGLTYAALLSPQGKYLADFFLYQDGDAVLLDVDAEQAEALISRLTMYRLRADVAIEKTDIKVALGQGDVPPGAFGDPRTPALGWRAYGDVGGAGGGLDSIYVDKMIPTAGLDLIPNESYILEMEFERLNGVDFRKGCYVGQEVTARMKHKTELRKGLAKVAADGPVETGDVIMRDGKNIGRIGRVAGDMALAHIRFDQAGDGMTAGSANIRLID